MNFDTLDADENLILSKNFTQGRSGQSIQYVVIHHNAGDLSIRDCYNVWQSRPASAHYQVDRNGRIGQLVWDSDTAWHAGNWTANCQSIGIEHANQGDSMTDATIENGAHLVASICKYYGLGRPTWCVNVFPHSHFSATACPGCLRQGTDFHNRYMELAQKFYDGVAPEPPKPHHVVERVENGIYRFYNEANGAHFYTASYDEAQVCSDTGWLDEGVGWKAPTSGEPVYRLYNHANGDHLFTCNPVEALEITPRGWVYEGVGFYGGDGAPVYRLCNEHNNSQHFYTASEQEKDGCVASGWTYEGVAFKSL